MGLAAEEEECFLHFLKEEATTDYDVCSNMEASPAGCPKLAEPTGMGCDILLWMFKNLPVMPLPSASSVC